MQAETASSKSYRNTHVGRNCKLKELQKHPCRQKTQAQRAASTPVSDTSLKELFFLYLTYFLSFLTISWFFFVSLLWQPLLSFFCSISGFCFFGTATVFRTATVFSGFLLLWRRWLLLLLRGRRWNLELGGCFLFGCVLCSYSNVGGFVCGGCWSLSLLNRVFFIGMELGHFALGYGFILSVHLDRTVGIVCLEEKEARGIFTAYSFILLQLRTFSLLFLFFCAAPVSSVPLEKKRL